MMTKFTAWVVLALSAAPALAAPVNDDDRGFISFTVENDFFGGSHQDQGYTNGLRLAVMQPLGKRPFWLFLNPAKLPLFAANSKVRFETAFGQSMFTPTDISRRRPDPSDRPYAGFTYVSFGATGIAPSHGDGRRLDQLQLTLGIVGPASLAGDTQIAYHGLIGVPQPKGWQYQLRNEPGIVLTYRRSDRLIPVRLLGLTADLTPHAGFAVGNVYTYADAGATLRIGTDLPDLGEPRIDPALPGSGYFQYRDGIAIFAFAGVDGRGVARNLFLDGNSFRDGPHVEKIPWVADFDAGIAMTYRGFRLSFTHVYRTREFHGQRDASQFGSINFGFAYH